jgi:hypothetical protein
MPILMAVKSKTCVICRSNAEISGSISDLDIEVFLPLSLLTCSGLGSLMIIHGVLCILTNTVVPMVKH